MVAYNEDSEFVEPRPNRPPIRSKSKNVWRDGTNLVIARHSPPEFEPRCVLTNKHDTNYRRFRFALLPHYVRIFPGPGVVKLIVLLVASSQSKVLELEVPVNKEIFLKRRNAGRLAWVIICLGLVGSLAMMIAYVFARAGYNLLSLSPLPLLACIIGMYYGMRYGQPILTMAKYDPNMVWIAGAHKDYLATLPFFRTPDPKR